MFNTKSPEKKAIELNLEQVKAVSGGSRGTITGNVKWSLKPDNSNSVKDQLKD
jgi:hypothetical protein